MNKKKIFLASSAELEDDRHQFEIFINRRNKDWVDKGAFLELVIWEDFLDAVSQTRLQDEYNRAIRDCDLFVMLFFTKVGTYTEEEFETAFGQFKATNKPLIFTYFKDAPISTGALDESLLSLLQFKKKLGALGHFYTAYKNVEDLQLKFGQQLDKLADSGSSDAPVNGHKVTNYFHSVPYQDLKKQAEELDVQFVTMQQTIEKYPDDAGFKAALLTISKKQNKAHKKLDDFKQEVIRLAETFTKLPINSERLKLAQQHFESGEYGAARAVLDAEQMSSELDALLRREEKLQQQQAEVQALRTDKANEYLILARLTAIDFTLLDRFEKAGEYFEQSLKAAHTSENTFAYAYFLQKHNQFTTALPWYEQALTICRRLADANPQTYLPYVATTLNNLASLQQATNEFPAALAAYEEALTICRRLAAANPQTYLPYVAGTLNNLGLLQAATNEFPAALAAYEEALTIRRRLAAANPQTYLPDVAMTAMNLSNFYLQALPDQERSLFHAREALTASLPFVEMLPAAQNYARTTLQVVEAWGLDTKTFCEEVTQSLKDRSE